MMSAVEDAIKQKAYLFLRLLYEKTGGRAIVRCSPKEVAAELGFTTEECQDIVKFLQENHLINVSGPFGQWKKGHWVGPSGFGLRTVQSQEVEQEQATQPENPWSGLSWDDVTIEIASDDSIKIKAHGVAKTLHYATIGFQDGRMGDLPDSRWAALIDLLENEGVLKPGDLTNPIELKPAMTAIRKRLKEATGIQGKSIEYDRREGCYRALFRAQRRPFEAAKHIQPE